MFKSYFWKKSYKNFSEHIICKNNYKCSSSLNFLSLIERNVYKYLRVFTVSQILEMLQIKTRF